MRATQDILADLLVIDLAGDADLRRRVPQALAELAEESLLVEIDGVWSIQTKESAEWDRAFRQEQVQVRATPGDAQRLRAEWLKAALDEVLRPVGAVLQGQAREARAIARVRGGEAVQKDTLTLRVRSGWDEDLGAAEREAVDSSPHEPVLHLLIPVQEREAVERALVRYLAAERVIAAKGPPSTEEGQQARAGLDTQRRSAESVAKSALRRAVDSSRVVLSGGGEQAGAPAEAVRASAERALKRLYTRFDEGDDARWTNALDRARRRQPDALNAIDHQGDADKHPVSRVVLDAIGAGKKGKELLETLKAPPYGWPQDAILAATIALANADQIEAKGEDGMPLVLAEVDARRFAQVSLRRATTHVSTAERLKVRSLMVAAGLPAPASGTESASVPALLAALEAAAVGSGGPAPSPAPEAVSAVADLRAVGPNEALGPLAAGSEDLKAALLRWNAAGRSIDARTPRFRLLEQLVRLGAAGQAEGVEAIRSGRRLLEEPDPVPPLVQAAAGDLRTQLNAAVDAYDRARAAGEARLSGDPLWGRLSPEQKAELRAQFDLRRSERPSVETPEQVRDALTAHSLTFWENASRAVPSHVNDLLAEAAALLEPQSQDVALPRGLLKTEADVDGWLAEARERLVGKLGYGPVIPKL